MYKKNIYSKEHKAIVTKLVQARKEAKLTQKQVAKKLHKTQSYISKVESSQLGIDIVDLKRFSMLYDKHLDYFVDFDK